MHIQQVMSANPETIHPDATLVEAARLMAKCDIGAIPVVGGAEPAEPMGLITDRDLVVRAIAEGRDPHTTQVRDVMTLGVTTVSDYQDAEDAARMMREHQIRRVVVVDRDNCCVGIVSLGDIAVRLHDEAISADALEHVSPPE